MAPAQCGFSHGAAGIATAFLALYSQTGRDDFRNCAIAGFLYARRAYNLDLANWPDYRRIYRHKHTEALFPRTNTAWCHGAAGIALSRIHALEVFNDGDIAGDAGLALRATYWILRAARRTHLAEEADRRLLATTGAIITERLSNGALSGAEPGMMTGISGVGWALRRRPGSTANTSYPKCMCHEPLRFEG